MFLSMFILIACFVLVIIIWFTFGFQTHIYIHNKYHAMLFDDIILYIELLGKKRQGDNYMSFMSIDNVHMYTSAINCLSVCLPVCLSVCL